MSSPIPRDIETTDQWQVRWEAPGGHEVVRTGSERQVRYMATANAAYGAVLEKRTITVGPWVDPDADAPEPEETDEADG